MGKVLKPIKKVFKKVAPIVLPIALGAIPSVGPIMAATLGSGIGTLIQGGSFKQALMSAAMGAAFSGGITSLAGKFGPVALGKSAFQAQGAIARGIGTISQKMINMTGGPLSQGTGITGMIGKGIQGLKTNLSKGLGSLVPKGVKDAFGRVATKFEFIKQTPQARELGEVGDIFSRGAQLGIKDTATTATQQALAPGFMTSTGKYGSVINPKNPANIWRDSGVAKRVLEDQGILPKGAGILEGDVLGVPKVDPTLVGTPKVIKYEDLVNKMLPFGGTIGGTTGDTGGMFSTDVAKPVDESLWKKITGGTADWWKGLSKPKQAAVAALGGLGLYAGYKALTTKEIEEMSPEQINQRIQSIGSATDPRYVSQFNPTGMYSSYPGRVTRNLFAYEYPTAEDTGPYLQPWTPAAKGGIMNAAGGGFQRKQGHINGPGTGTSDDVPAMLSDGEFVMTAKAVRNAGGGSRALGARRMYGLMDNLERGIA